MAVVKLTRSGKALLFIDDVGNSFITSVSFVRGLLDGLSSSNLLLLKRLPDRVSSSRFMKSPVLEFLGDGSVVEHSPGDVVDSSKSCSTDDGDVVSSSNDSLSVRGRDDRKYSFAYNSSFDVDEV